MPCGPKVIDSGLIISFVHNPAFFRSYLVNLAIAVGIKARMAITTIFRIFITYIALSAF